MRRAVACIVAVLACGCAVDEIVVATIPDDGGSGDGGPGGCSTNDDCQPTELCARTDCAQPTGVCEIRPVLCDGFAPTCGCDGVTYWNDCLRRRLGVTASTPMACATNAAKCSDPSASACPLPSGVASCARILPPGATCSPNVPGVCWVLPAMCPSGPPGDRLEPCGFPRTCVGACEAIGSGLPHRFAPRGVCP